jgi:hypothetical protein
MISIRELGRTIEYEESKDKHIPNHKVKTFEPDKTSRILYINSKGVQCYGYSKNIELAKGYKVMTTHNFDEVITEITENKTQFTNLETKKLEYILREYK